MRIRSLLVALVLGAGASTLGVAGSRFADNGDGTVTDPTTGLIWMRCSMGQTWTGSACNGTTTAYTWDQANALAGTVSLAGKNDWRVPNIRELQTIADRSTYGPAIDATAFPNTPTSYFWSASTDAQSPGLAWYVNFNYGNAVDPSNKGNTYAVRLVRAGESSALLNLARPTSDYVDHGDGTVTHTPTGLMWKRCAEGQNWDGSTCTGTASAVVWAAARLLSSAFAGKNDWRLPTQEELLTLVDYTRYLPAINTSVFPNTFAANYDGAWFWSASANANNISTYAWYMNVLNGYADGGIMSHASQVRLVRTGQPSDSSTSTTTPTTTSSTSSTTTTAAASTTTTTSASTTTSAPGTTTSTAASTTSTTSSTTTTTLTSFSLTQGWNLVGNGVEGSLDVAATFGDATKVTTVWKWVISRSTAGVTYSAWAFYAPSPADGGQSYAASKGYEFLTTIEAGEGFWINANEAFTATLPAGKAIKSSNFLPVTGAHALKPGWNLVATGDSPTPSNFNSGLSTTPPTAGTTPDNVTTLWAWDAIRAGWYFWAPSLVNSGGLSSYITSKGYLDFATMPTTPAGTLSPTTGFWVNMPVQ